MITKTSVSSLYRWLEDVDRTQLAQSHLDIAFAADQIEPEPEPVVGGERGKKDKRRQRISKAARVAASVAASIIAALASPPPQPKAARKKAPRKGGRGKRKGKAHQSAAVLAPQHEPVAVADIIPAVAVVPKRRAYAKSGSAYDMARANSLVAAHLYVKPADIERARKMAVAVRDRSHKLSAAARRFLVGRVKKNKYLDCFEMRKAIDNKYRVKVCDSTIYNYLSRNRMSYKKRAFE